MDLSARLYQPRHLGAAYFHGASAGFFCLGSGRWPGPHAWCVRLAAELPAVVVSFDYRLAPEHRLPAAQENGAAATAWLQADAAADPWLADAADFARVFVVGDSAGGNIAHHVAVRFGKTGLGAPVRLRGHVLVTPAVTGAARTRAEAECPPDAALTADMIDGYARMFLPDGSTKDHSAVNLAGPEAPPLEAVPMAPVLVVAAERDALRDRHAHYARRMEEEWGKHVEYAELAGVGHGFLDADPWSQSANELLRLVRMFVVEHMDSE